MPTASAPRSWPARWIFWWMAARRILPRAGCCGAWRRTGKSFMTTEEPRPMIDTSKMSAGQRAALELTEAARETAHEPGFVSGLFMGEFNLAGIAPFPVQSAEDRDQGDAFLGKLETLLRDRVDPDEIDRTGEIPQPVMDELAKLGAFGIKVSPEYGGRGLSQRG